MTTAADIFSDLNNRITPEKASSINASYLFDIGGDDGGIAPNGERAIPVSVGGGGGHLHEVEQGLGPSEEGAGSAQAHQDQAAEYTLPLGHGRSSKCPQ